MELSKHLIVKTNPISDSKAQVIGNGFRITVLTDRLFRVETSKTNTFIDDATQGVFYRHFEVPFFSVKEEKRLLTITTDKCSLVFDKSAKNSLVHVRDEKVSLYRHFQNFSSHDSAI